MSVTLTTVEQTARNARALVGLVVVGVIAAVTFSFCHHAAPTPLPAKVQTAVERHEIQTVVDSVELQRLAAAAAAAQLVADSNEARARRSETRAQAFKVAADSLAMEAVKAKSSADSAARFQAAYVARSHEADSLATANRLLDSARSAAVDRGDTLAVALTRSEIGRRSADSLVSALVGAARQSPTACRFALFIPCPSRKTVAVVSAAVGAGVAIAVTNHAKIPLGPITIQLARIPIR